MIPYMYSSPSVTWNVKDEHPQRCNKIWPEGNSLSDGDPHPLFLGITFNLWLDFLTNSIFTRVTTAEVLQFPSGDASMEF